LEFAVVPGKDQISFGLAAVKNVGVGAVEEILRARDVGGPFASIQDFVERVDTRIVNKKAMESLVKAGAFDDLADRDTLLYNLDAVLGLGSRLHKQRDSGQIDLFGDAVATSAAALTLDEPPAATPERERLQWERELLGIYLSNHPLEAYKKLLEEQAVPLSDIKLEHDGLSAKVGGIITTLREITTKNGSKMAFVGLEDATGNLELIVFPGAYEALRTSLSQDSIVIVSGRISSKDRSGRIGEELKLLAEDVRLLSPEEAQAYRPTGQKAKLGGRIEPRRRPRSQPSTAISQRLFIHVKDPNDHDQLLKLKKTLNKHPGATEAILVLGETSKSALKLPFRVDIQNGLKSELEAMLSPGCVAVR
jgi:DNA polymerase-3 subunit alpha